MSGAILQLVSFGKMDKHLTDNPTIILFKYVFKRHTNFSIEPFILNLSGTKNFGNTCFCDITKKGDLLSSVYLNVTLPKIEIKKEFPGSYFDPSENQSRWVNRVGWKLLKSVTLKIGGYEIDKIYSTWMHIWSELNYDTNKKFMLDRMVGTKGKNGLRGGSSTEEKLSLQIPLIFSFCRHKSLALPLIALTYNNIVIEFEFDTIDNCYFVDNSIQKTGVSLDKSLTNVFLICNYVFLDNDEKENFKIKSYDYLIETLKVGIDEFSLNKNLSTNIPLILSNPIKELYWVIRKDYNSNTGDKFTDFTSNAKGIVLADENFLINDDIDDIDFSLGKMGNENNNSETKIILNGIDRIALRNGSYFNFVQPYQHHTGCPDIGINSYSFSLFPEKLDPSGVCNFSRILENKLFLKSNVNGKITLYGLAYNILRINSGMANLVYT